MCHRSSESIDLFKNVSRVGVVPLELGVKICRDTCCFFQLSQQKVPLLLLQDPSIGHRKEEKKSQDKYLVVK